MRHEGGGSRLSSTDRRGPIRHASEETTRKIYLAPVSDLQIRSLLLDEADPGTNELLARIAKTSERILDSEAVV